MMKFNLTEDHIRLLKQAHIVWGGRHWGAPGIDPKQPFGSDKMLDDVCEIIGEAPISQEFGQKYMEKSREKAKQLYSELDIALQIVLVTGKFEAGTYEKKEKYNDLSWGRAL